MPSKAFDPSTLGAVLRKARQEMPKEPTLEDMAEWVGVSVSMIGNTEKGLANPSEGVLRKWFQTVGLPPEWAAIHADWRAQEEALAVLARRKHLDRKRIDELRGVIENYFIAARAAPATTEGPGPNIAAASSESRPRRARTTRASPDSRQAASRSSSSTPRRVAGASGGGGSSL